MLSFSQHGSLLLYLVLISVLISFAPSLHADAFATPVLVQVRVSAHWQLHTSSPEAHYHSSQERVLRKFLTLAISKNDDEESASSSSINETQANENTRRQPTPKTNNNNNNRLANIYTIAGIASALAWIVTSYVALSFHPDPKFADCTLRHNLLTMGQAFAFPLSIGWACFAALRSSCARTSEYSVSSLSYSITVRTIRRLNIAIGVASLWLAASSAFAPAFAFGYDLYSLPLKITATTIHAVTALLTLSVLPSPKTPIRLLRGTLNTLWNLGPNPRSTSISDSSNENNNCSLYATGALGLLWFAILPVVSPYPLATIPSILGKRLSRPASAFSFLGSVVAFCLKEHNNNAGGKEQPDIEFSNTSIQRTLKRGLAVGSSTHLLLIALKLIGVDGGGLLLPGRGLWEVYPAMLAVPFSAGVSMAVHAILCVAACT